MVDVFPKEKVHGKDLGSLICTRAGWKVYEKEAQAWKEDAEY